MKYYGLIATLLVAFLVGCGGGGSSSNTNQEDLETTLQVNSASDLYDVVINAKDATSTGSMHFYTNGTFQYDDSEDGSVSGTWTYDTANDTINYIITSPAPGTAYTQITAHTLNVDGLISIVFAISGYSDVYTGTITSISSTSTDTLNNASVIIIGNNMSQAGLENFAEGATSEVEDGAFQQYNSATNLHCSDYGFSGAGNSQDSGGFINTVYLSTGRICTETDASATLISGDKNAAFYK